MEDNNQTHIVGQTWEFNDLIYIKARRRVPGTQEVLLTRCVPVTLSHPHSVVLAGMLFLGSPTYLSGAAAGPALP